jgi:hypothetical protein
MEYFHIDCVEMYNCSNITKVLQMKMVTLGPGSLVHSVPPGEGPESSPVRAANDMYAVVSTLLAHRWDTHVPPSHCKTRTCCR